MNVIRTGPPPRRGGDAMKFSKVVAAAPRLEENTGDREGREMRREGVRNVW